MSPSPLPPGDGLTHLDVVPVTFVAVPLAGVVSARIGGSRPTPRPALCVVLGGALGLALTYGIGHLVGTAVSSNLHDARAGGTTPGRQVRAGIAVIDVAAVSFTSRSLADDHDLWCGDLG